MNLNLYFIKFSMGGLIMKLNMGDKIGIFSPSTPITKLCPSRFNRAKEFIQSKGFEIIEGSLTGKSDFYRSGNIKERAEELNQLIRNPEVKCIMATIGGMNSNSLLPYIDYESFKKNPKIIIGYSDVTAILMAIYAKTEVVTFYGPALVASFGEFPPYNEITYSYFQDILVKNFNNYIYRAPEFWTEEFIGWELQNREKDRRENSWVSLREGIAEGRLIIGNLNTMSCIWGTEYMPKIEEGDILFIEDSLKDIATVERLFSLLKLSGIFNKLSGLIYGKHELFKDCDTGRKPYEVLLEVLDEFNFPLLVDVDCSHTHPMFTMPLGGYVRLNTYQKSIELLNIKNT